MSQLAQFLKATGRRLCSFLTKIVRHLFRFIEMEVIFETDWERRKSR